MIKQTIAALLALTGSAWAQTTEPVVAAPAETAEPAPQIIPPVGEVVETPAPQAIPTDPMELVAFALAAGREAEQCRFAFTRLQTTNAQVGWSDADAEAVLRFDPRLAVGQRWTLIRATRQQRGIERAMAREDRKGLPFDLMALPVQGEWAFENVAFVSEHPDRYIYSYAPRVPPERAADETGVGIIQQLVGQLEVSRETGRVLTSALREPPANAVRAMGIVRVHRALLNNVYSQGPNGLIMADSGSQMFVMSAMLSQTEVTSSFRFTDVEPICESAEVARITQAEAAARASRRR